MLTMSKNEAHLTIFYPATRKCSGTTFWDIHEKKQYFDFTGYLIT